MDDHTTGRRLRRAGLAAALAMGALAGAGGAPGPLPTSATPPVAAQVPADDLRLNQIQVVGSHNSYHLAASPQESAVRRQFIGAGDDALQYAHAPLGVQLAEQKVRQIELDIFRDDAGGLYSEPLLRAAAGHGPYDAAMDQPGTKVLHVQDVDYRSTCLTLVACLQAVETWSDANPDHLPVAILLELKDGEVGIGDFPFVVPEPWTADAMDALDEEIRGVMDPEDLITPDDVRVGAATLEDAVLDTGWPTLGASRGKVMFLMDNGGGYRTSYLQGHPALQERVMFTNAEPGQDDAAFVKVNDSRADEERIQDLVAEGYVVRTRADAETVEARTGDTSGREAAFRSGAQWVSTDYPVPEYARPFRTRYVVEVPGGTIARCNPVTGPAGCRSGDIEPLPELPDGPYVEQMYQSFFRRPSTNADRWYWARRLEQGTSRASVARALTRSPDIVSGPFLVDPGPAYLDRELALEERRFWTGYLSAGRPYEHLLVGFLASPEMYAGAGGTPTAYVEALFERVLQRPVDEASLVYFVDRLETEPTRWTIARQVLGALESRRLRAAADVETMLDRDATAEEVARFAEVLRLTRDDRDVAVQIAATDEYRNRSQR